MSVSPGFISFWTQRHWNWPVSGWQHCGTEANEAHSSCFTSQWDPVIQ